MGSRNERICVNARLSISHFESKRDKMGKNEIIRRRFATIKSHLNNFLPLNDSLALTSRVVFAGGARVN